VFWRASAKVSSGKFRLIDFYSIDRLQAKFDRSIEFFRTSEFSKQFHMNYVIPHLLTYKT